MCNEDNFVYYTQGVPKNADLKSSLTSSIYGFLVWFFVYFELQLVSYVIPGVCSKLCVMLTKMFPGYGLGLLITAPIHLLTYSFKLAGFMFMCVLYGWYGFDLHWVCDGLNPDDRWFEGDFNPNFIFNPNFQP